MASSSSLVRSCAAAIAVVLSASDSPASAAFDSYGRSFRPIDAPAVAPGSFATKADALADGRLVAVTGLGVYLETGVGTGAFTLAATIDSALVDGATDPSFVSVSPDGSRIALGAGFDFASGATRPVVVFDSALLEGGAGVIDESNASAFQVEHFDAAWADNSRLAITAGSFGSPARVDVLDVTSDASAPSLRTAIDNIQGASAGVAFDSAGNLFTGNGFDLGVAGATETGAIKAFSADLWEASAPADFEAQGAFIGEALSASTLDFDHLGNLFVGGGDFSEGDAGYAGVIAADAIAEALAGFGAFDLSDPFSVRRLDPAGTGDAFYSVLFNGATGELILSDGANFYATIPAPAGFSALLAAPLLLGRRRHAA